MAAPSRSTRAGWESLTCSRCGKRIYMNGERAVGAMFSRRLGSICGDCLGKPPAPRMLEPHE